MEWVLAIGITVLMIVLIFCLLNMSRDKRYHDEYMKMLSATLADRPDEYVNRIKYTDEFLKYLDTVIASTSNIMFKEFLSQMKSMDKITKIKVQQLVENTANKVLQSLEKDNINTDELLTTTDYWTWYIVNLVVVTINDKFEKALIEIIE